jgi:cytoskeletal protein RodZ
MRWGEKLKEAREKYGYTIDDVEEETKIRKLYLEALENEDFDLLPPRIYSVGFVKRYARLLNLDEKTMADEFKLMAYGQEQEENNDNNDIGKIAPPFGPQNRIKFKNVFAGLLFLAIALWLGNFLLAYILDGQTADSLPDKTPVVEEPVKNNETAKNGQPRDNITEADDLSVLAKGKCWLLIIADGEEIFQGTLQAGAKQDFNFEENKQIYLKAGNAGGLELSINGEKQDELGQHGEVIEMEFFLEAEDQ